MALWQYTFQVLPGESFSVLKDNKPFSFEDDLFDDELYWKFTPINKNHFDEIGRILNKNKSWSEKVDLYGNLETNCLELFYNTQTHEVESVSFRIDFTSDFEMILKELVEFFILQGFIILDESFQLVPLNYEIVRSVIGNSQQLKIYSELKNDSPD